MVDVTAPDIREIVRLRCIESLTLEEISERIRGVSRERVRQILLQEKGTTDASLDARRSREFDKFKKFAGDGNKWWEADWLAYRTRCLYAQEIGLLPKGYFPRPEKASVIDRTVELHEAGLKPSEIKSKLGLSIREFNRLRRLLEDLGIKLGTIRSERTRKNLEVVRKLAADNTVHQVAEKTGISPMTLYRYRSKYGVEFASSSGSAKDDSDRDEQRGADRPGIATRLPGKKHGQENDTQGKTHDNGKKPERKPAMSMSSRPPGKKRKAKRRKKSSMLENDALLQVYIPSKVKQQLKKLASEQGTDVSSILRPLLEDFAREAAAS